MAFLLNSIKFLKKSKTLFEYFNPLQPPLTPQKKSRFKIKPILSFAILTISSKNPEIMEDRLKDESKSYGFLI